MPLFDQPQKQPPKRGLRAAHSRHEFAEFADAYWQAARTLANLKQVPSEEPPNHHAFPIGFLYRHALEVAVKSLLLEHGNEVGISENDVLNPNDGQNRKKKRHHSFGDFVGSLAKLRNRYPPAFEGDRTTDFRYRDLEQLLEEWDKTDPDAVMFRYGVKKNLKSTRSDPDFVLDVSNFAARMDAAMEYLFAVDDGIFQLINQEFLRQELAEFDEEAG